LTRFIKYFIGLLFLVLVGCSSPDPVGIPDDKEYLPLKKGNYQVYHVEGIQYSEVFPIDTFSYQLMTQVVDSFPNAENNFTYVIYRSFSYDSGNTWEYEDSWSVRLNEQYAVVGEESVSFVKFILPVKEGGIWNGNLFNTIEPDEYVLETARESIGIENQDFSDCIRIRQNDDDDFVKTDQREEIYARGVGLIFVEKRILNYCTEEDCFGQKIIKDGIIYKQSILSYGGY